MVGASMFDQVLNLLHLRVLVESSPGLAKPT